MSESKNIQFDIFLYKPFNSHKNRSYVIPKPKSLGLPILVSISLFEATFGRFGHNPRYQYMYVKTD